MPRTGIQQDSLPALTTEPVTPAAVHALRHALKGIDAELRWFRMANGAVSRDDLTGMIRAALAHIDGVRELVYADEVE